MTVKKDSPNYKLYYTILHNHESLTISQSDKVLYDKTYKAGSCIIDLVYVQKTIPIDKDLKMYVESYLDKYIIYRSTGDFSIISDSLIQASTYNSGFGNIVNDPFIKATLTTSDIKTLINFMFFQLKINDTQIKKCENCKSFYVQSK